MRDYAMIAAAYNGQLVKPSSAPTNKKAGRKAFNDMCFRCYYNVKRGTDAFVRDETGGFFKISQERRSAARVSENDAPAVAALFEAKP